MALCKELVAVSEQEAADRAKGIVVFQCVKDAWEPGTFHFWERYESELALGNHNGNPRMTELYDQLEPLLQRPMGMSMYEMVDGRISMSCIHIGPKGEGGLDDATGASGAAGGASYKQTSRAIDLTGISEHEEAQRDQAILDNLSGKQKAAAGAAAAAAAAAPGAQKQPGQAQKQDAAAAAAGAGRLPGGLGALVRAVQGQAEGFSKCVAHYVSAVMGGGK